jgi:hypothetical protein
LDITSILSIIMALIVSCVIWENVTSLMRGAKFWEKWENTQYPEKAQARQPPSEDRDDWNKMEIKAQNSE